MIETWVFDAESNWRFVLLEMKQASRETNLYKNVER
jgi:hypothetical protein